MKSDLPKVLHRIAGRPLLHWVVTAARAAGAGRVVAILGHRVDVVQSSLDAAFGPGAVEVALQPEQRGTDVPLRMCASARFHAPRERRSTRSGMLPFCRT